MSGGADDREAAERFFAAYEQKYPLETVRTPETPEEMVVDDVVDSPGWVRWRYCPWSTSHDIFREIELSAGLPFPTSFRDLLTTYHTLSVDLGFVRLPETPLRHEHERLRALVLEERYSQKILSRGFLPFAWDGRNDYGLLCFDRREAWSGEIPVICIRTYDGSLSEEYVASGFRGFRDACIYAMETPVDFLRLAEVMVDSDEARAAAFDAFLACDPTGMATTGRRYWMGVAQQR